MTHERRPNEPQPNRVTTRLNRMYDPDRRTGAAIAERRNLIYSLIEATAIQWGQEVERSGKIITRIVYHGKPFIYSWLDARRGLHELKDSMVDLKSGGVNIPQEWATEIQEDDNYPYKRNGMSLFDIEQMEYPLSLEDIKRLNRMMPAGRFGKKPSIKDTDTLQTMIYLASVPYAQPETRRAMPKSLEPLHRNLSSYYDYYVDLLDNKALADVDELRLASTILWNSSYLIPGISSYLPARLEISPSSAMKLFEHHGMRSRILEIDPWSKLYPGFNREVSHAYRKNGAPVDLQKFLQSDPLNDKQAVSCMSSFFERQPHHDTEEFRVREQSGELLHDFTSHAQQVVQKELSRSREKRIQYKPGEDVPIKHITVTAQYEGTTILILHLPDNAHITLEVNRQGKVFGIPPQLVKAFPNTQDRLLTYVLPPLIERQRTKHSADVKSSTPTVIYTAPERRETQKEVKAEAPNKPLKRKQLFSRGVIHKGEPEIPTGAEPPSSVRFVPYTESQIRDLLGAKRKQTDVDAVIAVLERFKEGWRDPEPIVSQREAKLYKLRAGNFRIAVQRLGGDQYQLDFIGDRKNFYDRYDER